MKGNGVSLRENMTVENIIWRAQQVQWTYPPAKYFMFYWRPVVSEDAPKTTHEPDK